MNTYKFKATNLIAETFEKHGVKFYVVRRQNNEQLLAGFPITCGPNVNVRFISCDNDNDVTVRIFGLIANTPKEKKTRVMEACNAINRKSRYIKFCFDTNGDIDVGYDFPVHTPDDSIGEMALEIFARTMQILDSEYSTFTKALYSEEDDIRSHIISREEVGRQFRELCKRLENETDDADASDEEFSNEFDDHKEKMLMH